MRVPLPIFCEQAAYRCLSEANPAPSVDSYVWYIDNEKQNNQMRSYFEIYNVTRSYHDKQVKCSVYNDLGRAEGLTTIRVKCELEIVCCHFPGFCTHS